MRWINYAETLAGPEASFGGKSTGFLPFVRNSFFISFMAVLGQVLSSSLVAFAFSRLQFRLLATKSARSQTQGIRGCRTWLKRSGG